MPETKYINFKIGGKPVDIQSTEDLPVTIDYQLESEDDFTEKRSSFSVDINAPATLNNDAVLGTYHDANVETSQSIRTCLIEANGYELLKGQAIIKSVTSQNGKPKEYKINCFGNNGDWMVKLKESSLHDFVSPHIHSFDQATIFNSWYNFNGNSEVLDYCYAPVRYRNKFGGEGGTDAVVVTSDLKPSISIYWIIWRAFRSLGYKIESTFMDSQYFRRQVMPWTWGDFLYMNSSKLDPLKFKATGTVSDPVTGNGFQYFKMEDQSTTVTLGASGFGGGGTGLTHDSWNMAHDTQPFGFDNGNNYSYANGIMKWVYNVNPGNLLGIINVKFRLTVPAGLGVDNGGIGSPGEVDLRLFYRRNGGAWTEILRNGGHLYLAVNGVPDLQNEPFDFMIENVSPGDVLDFKLDSRMSVSGPFQGAAIMVWARSSQSVIGANPTGMLLESYFETLGFYKTEGSKVDFKIYDEFKNHKFLDLLRGIVDMYDLSIQTDSINKVVRMEPTNPYYTGNNPNNKIAGYFTDSKLNWTEKRDLSKVCELDLYSDAEQVYNMRFRDDGNDGGVKVFNERYSQIAGSSKYVFPDRFKAGKKDQENRFFAPTVHVNMEPWRGFMPSKSIAPQIIALVPENIANTSADATENKFQPRIAYCKGVNLSNPNPPNGKFNFNGALYFVPEMFAVNYNSGGENDPVLSYNDQKINNIVVHGLTRRFYLPRFAIMRYGKRLKDWFYLTNGDVTNWFHREKIVLNNATYHLINIDGYAPLKDESTQCVLWKYFPVTQADSDSLFPSLSSVAGTGMITGGNDTTYNQLLLLASDIP